MNAVLRAIDRYLNALARTPGEEFSHGMYRYQLIEHPREVRPWIDPEQLGDPDRVLRRAS